MTQAAQFNARLGLALCGLAIRYLDLVAEGRNADAAAVRRAFTTLYLSRGGRSALVALGVPAAALPTTIPTTGWSSNLRVALQGAIRVGIGVAPALSSMPTSFDAVGGWWRRSSAEVQAGMRLTALEVLMDLEAVPAQEGPLLAAVDLFLAGPPPVLRDPWVDQPDAPSHDTGPSRTDVRPANTPTVPTPSTPDAPRDRVRGGDVVFTLLGERDKTRTKPSVSWPWIVAGLGLAVGLGYGGYLVYRDRAKKRGRA